MRILVWPFFNPNFFFYRHCQAQVGGVRRATKQPRTIQGGHAQLEIASSPLQPFIAMTRRIICHG